MMNQVMAIKGDARLLRIALENLLGNAWKYTSKKASARIEFCCMENDGEQVYYIRDDGVGFDMKYVKKLFSSFQRLQINPVNPVKRKILIMFNTIASDSRKY